MMKYFLESVKKILNRDNFDKIIKFCIQNKRYFFAALLLVAMILVLYSCTGKNGGKERPSGNTEEGGTEINGIEKGQAFAQDSDEELNTLIHNYLTAYAGGDIDTLEQIAHPLSNNEKSYIGVFSEYKESYQNVVCYTKPGLTDGSYLVYVYSELKFYGIDTPAPSLDFFYIETDEENGLFINNVYSPYNWGRLELAMEPDVYAVIMACQDQADVIALKQNAEAKLDEAMTGDVDLAKMFATTMPNVMKQWVDSVNALDQATEEETQEEPTQEEPTEVPEEETQEGSQTEEESEEPPKEPESEPAKVTITASSVNIRKSASTSAEAIGSAVLGDTFTRLGEEGEWTKIDFEGTTAYVKTEFVKAAAN